MRDEEQDELDNSKDSFLEMGKIQSTNDSSQITLGNMNANVKSASYNP